MTMVTRVYIIYLLRGNWSKREFIDIMKGEREKGYRVLYFVEKFTKVGGKEKIKNICLDALQDIR